jgi:quinol monooxygenase YgiN
MKKKAILSCLGVITVAAITAGAASPGAVASESRHQNLAPSRGDRGGVDTVVASFDHIAPAYRAEFLAAAQKEAYLSLKREKGTISYHIVPDPTDNTRVIFEATFANADAYTLHRDDYPAKDFLKLVAADGIDGPDIIVDNTALPNTDS